MYSSINTLVEEAITGGHYTYRCEGGSSVVFQYSGPPSTSPLHGHILRVKKLDSGHTLVDGQPPPTSHSPGVQYLSRVIPQDKDAHARTLMGPLLAHSGAPSQCTLESTPIPCPPGTPWLVELNAQLLSLGASSSVPTSSPLRARCRGEAPLDTHHTPSVTLIQDGGHSLDHPLCIEIKPKGGALLAPWGEGGLPCRFCAMAVAKAGRGVKGSGVWGKDGTLAPPALVLEEHLTGQPTATPVLTHYCPLDLYSGDPVAVGRALEALVAQPLNNFRVFHRGRLVYGGEDWSGGLGIESLGEAIGESCFPGSSSTSSSGGVVRDGGDGSGPGTKGGRWVIDTLTQALCGPHSPLPALKTLQGLAVHVGGEEGAVRALECLNGDPRLQLQSSPLGPTPSSSPVDLVVPLLRGMEGGERGAQRIEGGEIKEGAGAAATPPLAVVAPLVAFLVSTCARDVSLLVQCGGGSGSGGGGYGRVVVIDLDPKHPRKIEDFAEKERGLVGLWRSGGGEGGGKVCACLRQY